MKTNTIMAAIDMHVKTLVCEIGYRKKEPKKVTFKNDDEGHMKLIKNLHELQSIHKVSNVLIAYEASGLGYVLHDRLEQQGFQCAVLAPTELLRSATGYKKKTDKKDAAYLYEAVRGHVLAGNKLHNIWIPDRELREDRDVVRARFDLGKKITEVKLQIHTHLKKYGIKVPDDFENWTKAFFTWLNEEKERQGRGFQITLNTLLRQLAFLEQEGKDIEKEIKRIAQKPRYKSQYEALIRIKGVALKTAMTFLTEMGDVLRFSNRRQVGSYIGLVPESFESGVIDDRKGHITRNGPYRLRSILNQALWVHLKYNGEERRVYDRIVSKNPKRKKKAVVAGMRRLGIRMWHAAVNAVKAESLINAA